MAPGEPLRGFQRGPRAPFEKPSVQGQTGNSYTVAYCNNIDCEVTFQLLIDA